VDSYSLSEANIARIIYPEFDPLSSLPTANLDGMDTILALGEWQAFHMPVTVLLLSIKDVAIVTSHQTRAAGVRACLHECEGRNQSRLFAGRESGTLSSVWEVL